jgi:hypothetical protein
MACTLISGIAEGDILLFLSDPPGKNILSCESVTEIRVIGQLVTLDDAFQINSVWPRQASRCEVPVANSGQKSPSAQTVSTAQFEHEPGRRDFMPLGASTNGSRRRASTCRRCRRPEP